VSHSKIYIHTRSFSTDSKTASCIHNIISKQYQFFVTGLESGGLRLFDEFENTNPLFAEPSRLMSLFSYFFVIDGDLVC
jgi:hypothetical protein